jgi:tetratricopeptide (TPR) repeat protein
MLVASDGCGQHQADVPTNKSLSTQKDDAMFGRQSPGSREESQPKLANVQEYRKRASQFLSQGRYELAIRDYDEVIGLDPTTSDDFDSRGFAYHMNNRQEKKALADYAEAIRLNPRNYNAYNNRAYLLATTLDDQFLNGEAAVRDAVKACELTDYQNPGYIDTLAVSYAAAGNFDMAIRWQRKALEFPDFVKEWGEQMKKQLKLFGQKKSYRE